MKMTVRGVDMPDLVGIPYAAGVMIDKALTALIRLLDSRHSAKVAFKNKARSSCTFSRSYIIAYFVLFSFKFDQKYVYIGNNNMYYESLKYIITVGNYLSTYLLLPGLYQVMNVLFINFTLYKSLNRLLSVYSK